MTSLPQIEVYPCNARLSTGPKTDWGRNVASRNALRRGLTAERVVLFDEDRTQFENFIPNCWLR
jgi:hypothetical protein